LKINKGIVLIIIVTGILLLIFQTDNVLRYKIQNGTEAKVTKIDKNNKIIAIFEKRINSNHYSNIPTYMEYNENLIVYNEHWKRTTVDDIAVGDKIEFFMPKNTHMVAETNYPVTVIVILKGEDK
jgi:hypothetical protein